MRSPSKLIRPFVFTMPEMARNVVVLPAPFAPISAVMLPDAARKIDAVEDTQRTVARDQSFEFEKRAHLVRPTKIGLDDVRIGLDCRREAVRDLLAEIEDDDVV